MRPIFPSFSSLMLITAVLSLSNPGMDNSPEGSRGRCPGRVRCLEVSPTSLKRRVPAATACLHAGPASGHGPLRKPAPDRPRVARPRMTAMARTGSTRPRFSRRLDCGIESAAVVGERSAALSRMHSLGLPVPSGFAITVDAFRAWRAAGEAIPADVWSEVSWRLEELTGALGRGHGAPTSSLAVCASPPERPPEPLSERGIGRAEGRDQVLVEVPGGPPRHRWADVRRAVETLWRRHAENMGDATAVIVHHLPGGSSGHGVIVSRDPATGSPGAVISFTPAGLLDQREPNAEGVEPAMLRHG